MTQTPKRRTKKIAASYVPYIDIGMRFASAILLGTYGGYWLDSKLSTLPIFMITGLLIGVASGFLTIYRAAYPTKKTDKDDE